MNCFIIGILFKQSLYPAQGYVSHMIYEVYTFSLTLFYFTLFPFIPFYFRKFEQQDMTLLIYYVLYVEFFKIPRETKKKKYYVHNIAAGHQIIYCNSS